MVCLYDYQTDIISRLFESWRTQRSVMMQMPTGTGKTHVLASVVKSLTYNEDRGDVSLCHETGSDRSECDGGQIWIVAHRRELVAQIEETMERYGIDGNAGKVGAMSIQWLVRHWDDVGGKPSFVIIDEAHHSIAVSYKELWSKYPEAKFLGLTATPCRMNHIGFTGLFDTLICSWSIAEFIRKGRLSAFDYVSIRPDSRAQRLIDSLEKRGADGDYQTKEMNATLNRQQSIGLLYESVMKYAGGMKGIVYAISIDHARSIAVFYNNKGISSVAIDSKTPAAVRKHMVDDFKEGKVKVLVNVDVFSEGFDCPDVEFVQMARPTLSLSKYLQQVGRGLRKSEGKVSCVLIDNVGLYRVFGLPTVEWNWEDMFRGVIAGKSCRMRNSLTALGLAGLQTQKQAVLDEMEQIVSHDMLLEALCRRQDEFSRKPEVRVSELKAWQDVGTGLWGLKRGRKNLTEARYVTVFDIRYDMAAVRFCDKSCGLVNDSGEILWQERHCRTMKFLKNRFLLVATSDNKEYYIDLFSMQTYDRMPKIKRYGNIELLRTGNIYYSRTRTVYVNNQNVDEYFIVWHRFYLSIFDYQVTIPVFGNNDNPSGNRWRYACLIEGDNDSFYWLYQCLADGSIIVEDTKGKFYHVEEGRGKTYIGDRESGRDDDLCRKEIKRLAESANSGKPIIEADKEKNRRVVLNDTDNAIPFKSGLKWGLKVGERITVPPIYRSVKPPVGRYCAVEKNYSQWGVITIDGTVIVEPRYSDVSIENNGKALLTSVTGKTFHVEL